MERNNYAVVQFDSGDESGMISVVPTNWLMENNQCYWPKGSKNLRTLIIKRTPPNANWSSHHCEISNVFATYEEALREEKRAVASSDSDADPPRGIGKRRIKHKSFNSFTPPPSLENFRDETESTSTYCSNDSAAAVALINTKKKPTLKKDKNVLTIVGNAKNNDGIVSKDTNINVADDTDDESDSLNYGDMKNNNSQVQEFINENINIVGGENISITNSEIAIPVLLTNDNFQLLFDHVLEIKSMTRLILHKVNLKDQVDYEPNKENILDDHRIKNLLPVDSIGNLISLEELVKSDPELSNQLFNKMLLTGGKEFKDFIKRCLTVLFTNEVASMCSWTGQKNNFRIGDTGVIKLVKNAVKRTFAHMTDKDFEMVVMNWFRFANQRKINEK